MALQRASTNKSSAGIARGRESTPLAHAAKRYWVAVACREHVKRGEAAGFCQACHGKRGPVQRMSPGDGLIYYSSVEEFGSSNLCQRFTALGFVTGESAYQFRMSDNFIPFRRNVSFQRCREAPIKPLINDLSFIKNKKQWGFMFRFGFFEIPKEDFDLIASHMLAESAPAKGAGGSVRNSRIEAASTVRACG